MKIFFTCLFMGWISISGIQAQTSDSLQSEPKGKINYRKYKWELTTGNILTLLRAPTSDFQTSLFIRKSVNQQVKNEYRTRKVGYRLRVNLNIDHNQRKADSYDSAQNRLTNVDYQYSSFRIVITPGYEWQQQWNRLQVFYGVDVPLSYLFRKTNQDTLSSNIIGTELRNFKQKQLNNDISIAIQPFFGAKFFFSSRLSVAFEANLILNLAFSNLKNESSDYYKNPLFDPFLTTSSYTNKRTRTYIYMIPLSIIYISYYFN